MIKPIIQCCWRSSIKIKAPFEPVASGDSLDWKDLDTDNIIARVLKRVKPGSIVLFHNGAKNTPAALPKILEKLLADGYKIVPVSELIYRENYTIDHRGRQIADKPEETEQ